MRIDVTKVDDEKLMDLFKEAFLKNADDRSNNLRVAADNLDVEIERDAARLPRLKLVVYGLAEHTTRSEFCNPVTKVIAKGGERVSFDVDGRGTAEFVFDGTDEKNSSDYVVNYKAV